VKVRECNIKLHTIVHLPYILTSNSNDYE